MGKATYSEVVGREDKCSEETEDGARGLGHPTRKSLKKEGCMNGGLGRSVSGTRRG